MTLAQQPQTAWEDENIHPTQLVNDSKEFAYLITKVGQWGLDRNITKAGGATALSQIKKLREEIDEIEEGILENNSAKIIDGIGDAQVVLIQISRLSGFGIHGCLAESYEEIKDRTGTMRCGVFVKQVDLDLVGDFDWVAFEKCTDADMVRDLITKAKAWDAEGRQAHGRLKG